MTDDQLAVERFLRHRDERSFLTIFRAHTPAMMMMALRLTRGSKSDAEDAIQEAWMRAVASLPRFAWRSSLRTWLTGIVINCCREVMRSAAPAPQVPRSARDDTGMDMERAIADLPEGSREVFVLHEIHGYTHQEVGDLLGIDAGTSKSQLHHARRALRQFLGDEDETRN